MSNINCHCKRNLIALEPIVEVNKGKIKGCTGQTIHGETIYKFLGIPYGKPPVGDLRFKAPLPVDAWQEIKDATKDGDACYNRDILHENSSEIQGGEDCLVLNVYTKNINKTDELKPVMVYIHGGSFVVGCNKSEIYGPEFLLTQDIVVVVMNYRLGLLGFLSLKDESLDIPGNAGLKDQTLALEWVQSNIRVFGGDPNNVTIFGESAGSASVHLHVLSSSSKGLFHKAILQSGVSLCPWVVSSSSGPAVAEALDKKGATDQELLNVLKYMTGAEIYELQEKIENPLVTAMKRPYGPIVEKPNKTAFITTDPFELITSGNYNHVPLFIGYTSDEGLLLELTRRMKPEIDNLYTYKTNIPWFLTATDEQAAKIDELMFNFYSKIEEPKNKYVVGTECSRTFDTERQGLLHCTNSISDDWVKLHNISPIFDDDFNSVIKISVSALIKKI